MKTCQFNLIWINLIMKIVNFHRHAFNCYVNIKKLFLESVTRKGQLWTCGAGFPSLSYVNNTIICCDWIKSFFFLNEYSFHNLLYAVLFEIPFIFSSFVSTFCLSYFMDFSMSSVKLMNSRLSASTCYDPREDDSCPVK